MKKFIAFTITVIMLISAIPVMAAGDTTQGADNAYFQVDNAYYTTLKKALTDALTSDVSTIKVLKDVTASESNLSVPKNKTVTLDLNGKTITTTAKNYYFFEPIKGLMTVKNGVLNMNRGFVVGPDGHLIFDDVSLTIVDTTAYARPAVKLGGAGNTELTVKDSYLKTVGPGESLVLIEHATDGVVNLTGGTTLEYAGVLDAEEQNCAAVAVQQHYGTGVVSTSPTSNTDLVLNVGPDAKIINTAPASGNSSYMGSCIVLQTQGNTVINLEKGATLKIDRIPGSSQSNHIKEVDYAGKVVVNDKGGRWIVNEETLKAGNMHLAKYAAEGETVVGWMTGDKLVKADEPCLIKDARGDTLFSPISYADDDFDMLDGAAIRTVEDERAIRFTTVVSKELIAKLGDRAKIGTLIAKGSTNPARYSGSASGVVNVNAKGRYVSVKDGKNGFHAAVFFDKSVDDTVAYKNAYSATSYIEITYHDGTTKTFYTDFDNENVRSMGTVAERLDKQSYSHTVVTKILEYLATVGGSADDLTALLIGYCTKASLYNGAFNSTVGWKAAGMGYIIMTESGKLIVIDGGNSEDAEGFYSVLSEFGDGNKVVVDHWIFTHPHGDHVNAFISMYNNPNIRDEIDVNNMVYFFPTDFAADAGSGKYNKTMGEIAKYYGAKVITPTKGMKITVDDATITFLFVPTSYSSYNTANKLSLIFTVETNKKIMFTGDIFNEGLTEAYNEYGSALKCDILQMPHHFLCDTGYKPFYQAADASAVLLPTCIAGYNAMYNDASYKNSTKHLANDWAAQNADEVYKAFDGTFEIEV